MTPDGQSIRFCIVARTHNFVTEIDKSQMLTVVRPMLTDRNIMRFSLPEAARDLAIEPWRDCALVQIAPAITTP